MSALMDGYLRQIIRATEQKSLGVLFCLDAEITTFAAEVEFIEHMLISLPSTEGTEQLWASVMQLYAAVPRRYLSLTAIRWTSAHLGRKVAIDSGASHPWTFLFMFCSSERSLYHITSNEVLECCDHVEALIGWVSITLLLEYWIGQG